MYDLLYLINLLFVNLENEKIWIEKNVSDVNLNNKINSSM